MGGVPTGGGKSAIFKVLAGQTIRCWVEYQEQPFWFSGHVDASGNSYVGIGYLSPSANMSGWTPGSQVGNMGQGGTWVTASLAGIEGRLGYRTSDEAACYANWT